jgi:hypothetical protein
MEGRGENVVQIGSLELHFLVDETQGSGSVVVFEFVVPANARVPAPHYHRDVDEVSFARRRLPQPDHEQSADRLPSPMVRLHIRLIAENDTLRLHAGDPLTDGAARQPNLASESFQGEAGILLKKPQYLVVLFVHVVAGLELLRAKEAGGSKS